jgi:hypothetical protein
VTSRQVIEQELSEGQPSAGRRRKLAISSIVVIPIAIGALVSIVLYSTRALPPAPPPLPTPLPSPSATDTFVRDGQVLLLEPATSAPLSVLPGEEIEIVLNTGVGQTVSTLEPFVLAMVPNPPCHVTAICGVKGAVSWTFVGRRPGETGLHVIFGTGDCPQRASCPRVLQLLIPVTVRSAPA